jgi:preprotein translocase subunit Sec63
MAIGHSVSIQEEILKIRKASAARDPWAVLGIPPQSGYSQIKSAQRKWIRRLHPDRWYARANEQLRNDVQEAFYQVQAAYFETLSHCATTIQDFTAIREPITPEPALSVEEKKSFYGSIRRLFSLWFHRDRPHNDSE